LGMLNMSSSLKLSATTAILFPYVQ
jgi:hypothetical protein